MPDWDDMCVVRTKGELALRSNDPADPARLAENALQTGSATPRSKARLWNLAAIACTFRWVTSPLRHGHSTTLSRRRRRPGS